MTTYQFTRYATDIDGLESTLGKYGVAIIPSVLDELECDELVSGIWDFIEHLSSKWDTPVRRDDEKTWLGFFDILPLHTMLIQHYGVGHIPICWKVRQNPKIVNIFAKFWKCKPEDLLVSFDGVGFYMPHEITKRRYIRKAWFHTDQGYENSEFSCVQSWVTGLDVRKGDATLAFMEMSHLYHEHFAKEFGHSSDGWHTLSDDEEQFYLDRGCRYGNIHCPKGSMVFWDSRTIHCGIQPLPTRQLPNHRAVIYLCYAPRNQCNEKQLEKKRKAYEEKRTTHHYPCKVVLFPKEPRTYGRSLPPLTLMELPKLGSLGMKLAGY